MKKIIIVSLLFFAMVFVPVVCKAAPVSIGISTEMIEKAQTDPEFKAALIGILKQMIAALQEQLNQIIAQQEQIDQMKNVPATSLPAPAPVFAAAPIIGCTDHTKMNYDPLATQDNGTCQSYQVLAASCAPELPITIPNKNVNFIISPSGGNGAYVYRAYFCHDNICNTAAFGDTGIQSKTVLVTSGDGQFVNINCSIDVEK